VPARPDTASLADGSPYPRREAATFERDVRRMFGFIAERYEWFDHVATFGNDYVWRARALWELDRRLPTEVRRALDVGCGTGELSRAVGRRYPAADRVAVDFTGAMVGVAARAEHPGTERAGFARATALRLPFAGGTFDLVTNGFVLRNLRDLGAGLREMGRVLRPGGVLLSLDLGEPEGRLFGRLFHAYFDRVVPILGRAVGSEGPYRYLPESLRSLPSRPELLALLRASGFAEALAIPLSGGVVTVFLARTGPSADQSR
jgi:demethylmenaquinone methyltransferase / 2-methoxy-6-polyprenyl-1,4-benzoquinol methylase